MNQKLEQDRQTMADRGLTHTTGLALANYY